MLDPTSPLYVAPRWDPALWSWLAGFARYCTDAHVEHAMSAMGPLGMDALRVFDALIEEEAITCGYTREGYFDVCATPEGLGHAEHEAKIIERYGYHPERCDGDELRRREPAFGPGVLGGVYYPEARTLNPARFLDGMARVVTSRGVELRTGVEVRSVRTSGGRATGVDLADGESVEGDAVVVATGPFAAHLTAELGCRLPVQAGKGYHRDIPVGEGGAPPLRVACVFNETSVFTTPMGDFVRFAGTMEFSGINHDMRRVRLEQLTSAAGRYLPALGPAAPRSEWCGLRPMSIDGLPMIGPVPGVEGVQVATGHGMLGLTLGPVSGEMIANAVTGVADDRLPPFSPARFA